MNESPRVVIVTGGAQGIGRATTEHLADHGYAVAVCDRDQDACAEIADQLGSDHLVRHGDVGDETTVRNLIAAVGDRYGRIDAVVNNAGGGCGNEPIETLDLARWNAVLAGNLTAVMLLAKHTTPWLRRAAPAAMVNIASTRALQSEPHTEAYAAAKGGILALTHALAISLGPAVRVNAIAPGWIDVGEWRRREHRRPAVRDREEHAQHPVGRIGRPEDIAELCAFLLSPAAGFITGECIVADGGMTRKMIYRE